MVSERMQLRDPYVGEGADGCRRSAQIDLEEADCLDPGERKDQCPLLAERWRLQAAHLEAQPKNHRPNNTNGSILPNSDNHGTIEYIQRKEEYVNARSISNYCLRSWRGRIHLWMRAEPETT